MPESDGGFKGGAVLFSEMTPPPGAEERFNAWYDNHHMPSHVYGVPGFRSGQRYKDAEKPAYLAIYELESPSTLTDEEYRTRKYTPDTPTRQMLSEVTGFTRYIGDEISYRTRAGMGVDEAMGADVVIGVFLTVPEARADEFVEWYETEHTPILLGNALWRMARHMRVVDANPSPFTHMVVHYVDDEAVLSCDELKAARATDWRNRLAAEDWFRPHLVHYRRRGKRYHKGEPCAKTFRLDF
ncbi:MAG: hypothetical protein WD470_00715 [Rhodospirillaceae bacterium]